MATFGLIMRKHGEVPKRVKGQVYVCNHTSTFDFAVLNIIQPYSVIG